VSSLFRRRRQEHRHDEAIRKETADVLVSHRESLKKVRSTLGKADETLAQEIRRLDTAMQQGAHH
jgi:hypothetical protein